MSPQRLAWPLAIAALLAVLAVLPSFAPAYTVSLMLSVLSYVIMATAWSIFSGSTRYVSLASAAFFGIGAYAFAYYGEDLPLPIIALIGAAAGFVVAVVVGLATLRLSGIYFVVFTFGLSELIRQLMIWWEINQTRTMVRHIYVDVWAEDLYYHLLVLCVITFGIGYLIQRSKLGLALRAIGEDEAVANHTGVNTTFTKVLVFGISAALIAATGALLTPRWTYVDPNIAFNPLLSFLVLIMALLGGGGRLYGPAWAPFRWYSCSRCCPRPSRISSTSSSALASSSSFSSCRGASSAVLRAWPPDCAHGVRRESRHERAPGPRTVARDFRPAQIVRRVGCGQ